MNEGPANATDAGSSGGPADVDIEDRSWWRLGADGWKAVLKSTVKEFGTDEISNQAAVVTLRIVLSLVPSMIAAVAIAATVIDPSDIERFVASAEELIPPSSQEFVTGQLEGIIAELGRGEVQVIGIAAGVFAASGAAVALMGALNKAYNVDEQRGFVAKRLASLGVLAALVLSLAAMFIAIVLGPSLLDLLLPDEVLNSPLGPLLTLGRYVVAVLVLITFFGFVFWFAPNRDKPKFRMLTPGAVVGVSGWLLLSYLFSLYARISGSYSATYGVFAGVIVLLVWLNYSFQVLLMGGELDHEIERHLIATAAEEHVVPHAAPAVEDDRRADLDAVDEDMPRHPGLVPTGASEPGGTADHGDRGGRGAMRTPRLRGVAASTPGASTAQRLWRRLGR